MMASSDLAFSLWSRRPDASPLRSMPMALSSASDLPPQFLFLPITNSRDSSGSSCHNFLSVYATNSAYVMAIAQTYTQATTTKTTTVTTTRSTAKLTTKAHSVHARYASTSTPTTATTAAALIAATAADEYPASLSASPSINEAAFN